MSATWKAQIPTANKNILTQQPFLHNLRTTPLLILWYIWQCVMTQEYLLAMCQKQQNPKFLLLLSSALSLSR